MRFFLDRNMSPFLAKMVDIYEREHSVRHHDEDERFHERTTDIEWIGALAKDDPPWTVISGDGRILKNKAEKKALIEANLTFFCMAKSWTQMPKHEYVWMFIKVWPEILESAKVTSPKIFSVSLNKVELYR